MTSELRVDKIHNEGGDNDSGLDMSTNDTVKVKIAGTNIMTIKEDGELELGTTSSSDSEISFLAATDGASRINFGDSGDADIGVIQYEHDGNAMVFKVNASERMRMRSAGQLMVGRATAIASGGVNSNHTFEQTTDGVWAIATHGDQSNNYGIAPYYATAHDGSGNHFLYCTDASANRLKIQSDGDVKNHDNSYGSTSDERIKQDIKDANSQWDDIKALKIRNYKKKDDVRQYKDKAWEQIGVIAQELEAAGMNKLVSEGEPCEHDIKSSAEFGTLNEDGTIKEVKAKVKDVKYSVLYMKAVKALQEAMTRIETLETKVAALEAK